MKSSKNRVVIGLPERYESAKEAVQMLEKRIAAARVIAEFFAAGRTKEELLKTLDGVYDDSL